MDFCSICSLIFHLKWHSLQDLYYYLLECVWFIGRLLLGEGWRISLSSRKPLKRVKVFFLLSSFQCITNKSQGLKRIAYLSMTALDFNIQLNDSEGAFTGNGSTNITLEDLWKYLPIFWMCLLCKVCTVLKMYTPWRKKWNSCHRP